MPRTAPGGSRLDRIERALAALAQEVARLKGRGLSPPRVRATDTAPELDLGYLSRLQSLREGRYRKGDTAGVVSHGGTARFGQRQYIWLRETPLPQLMDTDAAALASVLAAAASAPRVRLLRSILAGRGSSRQLQAVMSSPSAGPLYHHLKELQSAGLVIQRKRNQYEIAPKAAVPVLAMMAAALTIGEDRSWTPVAEENEEKGDSKDEHGRGPVASPAIAVDGQGGRLRGSRGPRRKSARRR